MSGGKLFRQYGREWRITPGRFFGREQWNQIRRRATRAIVGSENINDIDQAELMRGLFQSLNRAMNTMAGEAGERQQREGRYRYERAMNMLTFGRRDLGRRLFRAYEGTYRDGRAF